MDHGGGGNRDAGDRGRGRPRAFDEAKVLGRAIALFSASGFSAVGISDLTAATGLTVGSLYKAYGDKEGVFAKALDRYIALREVEIAAAFKAAKNGRARIAALLGIYAGLSRGKDGKLGCMVVAGITDLEQLGPTAPILRAALSRRRAMLAELVAAGQRDGSITTASDPRTVAELILALLQGMRVVGKGGVLTDDPDAFIALALRILD